MRRKVGVLLIGMLVLLMSLVQPHTVSAGINVWTSNGPEGGRIYALAVDPQIPTTLYAGTYGGVFKSTNGGAREAGASGRDSRGLRGEPDFVLRTDTL